MDDLTYQELYLFQDGATNPNITTTDILLSIFCGGLLITVLTLALEQWRKQQMEEMKENCGYWIT